MMHMERVAEMTGRGFAKAASLAKKVAANKEPDERWLTEPTEQSVARVAATKVRTRAEQRQAKRATRLACPHAIVRHKLVPHPRYGKAVPHFASWVEPLTGAHDCISGRFR